jgi:flavin-dependent dehydrogenase
MADYRSDIDAAFDATLAGIPQLGDRLAVGRRVERFRFTSDTGGFYRVPYGPGWALVGDAGYHKDPITAQGMRDALRDAELLAEAVATGLSGGHHSALDHALAGYHAARDLAIGDITPSPAAWP